MHLAFYLSICIVFVLCGILHLEKATVLKSMQNSITIPTELKGFIETIRINKGNVHIKVVRATGKEGDFYVCIAPSIQVSGYGRTKKEAQESFEANMNVFFDDIMALNTKDREHQLRILGFKKELFKQKNFSKTYVDKNGELQNFEVGTVETNVLEATC
jgi:hypothetical protein